MGAFKGGWPSGKGQKKMETCLSKEIRQVLKGEKKIHCRKMMVESNDVVKHITSVVRLVQEVIAENNYCFAFLNFTIDIGIHS